MKTNMTKIVAKIVKKTAHITADAGSFLYCYQPKEPTALNAKNKVKKK